MTQTIRLFQEGISRTGGFQLTQWTAVDQTTDSLESLFIFRKTSTGEVFDRVATVRDIVAYPVNELKFFEGKGVNGNAVFSAVMGDLLTIDPAVDYWLQSGAPYDDSVFVIGGFSDVTGSTPVIRTGQVLSLGGYSFSDEDVGRWFSLSGFSESSYNAPVQVVEVLGINTVRVQYATVVNVTGVNTGSSWSKRRIRIQTAFMGQEPRYFPTLERSLGWTITHFGDGTPYVTGTLGETSRTDPTLPIYRDRRATSIEPSQDAAIDRMTLVRAQVSLLQVNADRLNTSFLGVTQTDYPA